MNLNRLGSFGTMKPLMQKIMRHIFRGTAGEAARNSAGRFGYIQAEMDAFINRGIESDDSPTPEFLSFHTPLPNSILDIEDKTRGNLFTWRGQFSPQLVESLLSAYCERDSVVFDPFGGSGTVLYECAKLGREAHVTELNPAAWILSCTYEFANLTTSERKFAIANVQNVLFKKIQAFQRDKPIATLDLELLIEEFNLKSQTQAEKQIFAAMIVLLDIYTVPATRQRIDLVFRKLSEKVMALPHGQRPVRAYLTDARQTHFKDGQFSFVLTSPPYINVFNYHQNYRASTELLGWDLLKVARSEIGSNRANRGNRFLTVVQYCFDMADALAELCRVCSEDARLIIVVGRESTVLGIPFQNSMIIRKLAEESGLFNCILVQERKFRNKFGTTIYEDLLHLVPAKEKVAKIRPTAERIAYNILKNALDKADKKTSHLLEEAVEKLSGLGGTPIFAGRERICPVQISTKSTMATYQTPHLSKLEACLQNKSLPTADRVNVEKAIQLYHKWIADMDKLTPEDPSAVEKLVALANVYKRFIELDLIFDSTDNFLYRQKGQLKLDNTIIEEFLPHLIMRAVRGLDSQLKAGPNATYSGISFLSTIGKPGVGGMPVLRVKDQDFVLGRKLHIMTSFDKDFVSPKREETFIGYVCAECKTNLDKTMFQEAVATSRDLKTAVPGSLYFLICEFLDMTPVSIRSTQIDDVLIVRKAKRISSNIRQEFKTPTSRKEGRGNYEQFLEESQYQPDVFKRMVSKIQMSVDDSDPTIEKVLKQGHF
jgi:hypothetical protein